MNEKEKRQGKKERKERKEEKRKGKKYSVAWFPTHTHTHIVETVDLINQSIYLLFLH